MVSAPATAPKKTLSIEEAAKRIVGTPVASQRGEQTVLDAGVQAGVETATNYPRSIWNFAKGAIESLNPVSIVKNMAQIPGEEVGLIKDLRAARESAEALEKMGGAKAPTNAERAQEQTRTIGGELEKTAPFPAGLARMGYGYAAGNENQVDKGIDVALQAVKSDPFGSVAPLVIGARQGAKAIDNTTAARAQSAMQDYVQNPYQNAGKPIPRGTGTNLGGMVDTAIEKTGQLVTKPVGAVASGIGEGISTGTRFGVSRATGLQPDTVTQVQKTPEAFTKENMAKADRADLANEVKTGLDARIEALDDTGSGYKEIRRSGSPVTVDRNWLDDVIRETTGLEVKKGKLSATGSASIRDSGDVRALQSKYDLWKPIFSKGAMTADEYLNFRADMAGLAKLDREVSKSKPLENLSNVMRGKFNTAYRKQLQGLEEMDADFSAQSTELKLLRKGILDKNDNLTDQAINRVANATGKGKDKQLARLEEIAPGISQKIKVMKAIEDIQNASGIKVGTYDRAALLGGSFVFGGALPAIITAVMTSPSVAVPMLRQYGLLKNAKAVNAVVQALKDSAGKVNAIPSTLDMDVKKLEGMKVKAGLSIEDVSKQYRYHTTSPKNLERIAKEGLNPSEGQYGRGVYFAPTIEKTGGYGSAEGAMIRVKRGDLPKDYDEFPEQGWTEKNVSPEKLEVSVDGGKSWKPLQSPTTLGKKSSPAVGKSYGTK